MNRISALVDTSGRPVGNLGEPDLGAALGSIAEYYGFDRKGPGEWVQLSSDPALEKVLREVWEAGKVGIEKVGRLWARRYVRYMEVGGKNTTYLARAVKT